MGRTGVSSGELEKERDSVLRAITDDGGFRVIATRTTETVREASSAQRVAGETARVFGELLTGAVLYRETMAPALRVQAILQGASESGQVVADSMPDGSSRGLVRGAKNGSGLKLSNGAMLQMMRTLPRGDIHRGVVEVPASGDISEALMAYMQTSEQVVSMISVGCQIKDGEVTAAGGYIVQLLPELSDPELAIMTERLKDFRTIDALLDGVAETPERLTGEILYGMDYSILEQSEIRFGCSCSELRVLTSLATLGRADLEELIEDGEVIEVSCDYCGQEYHLSPEQLRGLIDDS